MSALYQLLGFVLVHAMNKMDATEAFISNYDLYYYSIDNVTISILWANFKITFSERAVFLRLEYLNFVDDPNIIPRGQFKAYLFKAVILKKKIFEPKITNKG